jgi:hypothetical protein
LNKENIGINNVQPVYDKVGYDEELKTPLYRLDSVKVSFFFKNNMDMSGEYIIKTHVIPKHEEIKDKIVEVINS